MATLKICVQKQRSDGFYPVYIRITHQRATAYIKTDKMVNAKGISKAKDIKDPYVVQQLTQSIVDYMERLNRKDIRNWSVNEVRDFLLSGDEDISFSEYARTHKDRMIDAGQERNARNYELAYQHLERFAGTTNVMFSHLTSTFVNNWIETLNTTHRAKEMYPICIRQIFKAAQVELNDYDNGIIRIKTNPWVKVKIPTADKAEKLAITPEACRTFFSAPIPESKLKSPLAELGRDVAMMILCLAGINTVDIYKLQKKDYYDGIIHYKRAKTTKFRADDAYIEMRVPPVLFPVFNKYLADEEDSFLFNFHKRHTTTDSFGANVNTGIKRLCESIGIPKEDQYCGYTFRHTWGTIAQNDCKATISEVAFAMNHSAGHRVTRGYIKIDFSPAWELNEKVIDLIFFTEKISKREVHHETETEREKAFERFSKKYMIKGSVFYKGKLLGEFEDIGFNNVDEVIAKLVSFVPDDVPERAMVQFRIENVDKSQTAIYERMKGKGF